MGGASWDLKGPMSREVLAGTFKQRNSATRGAGFDLKKTEAQCQKGHWRIKNKTVYSLRQTYK